MTLYDCHRVGTVSTSCLTEVLHEVDGALHKLDAWQAELQKMQGMNRSLPTNGASGVESHETPPACTTNFSSLLNSNHVLLRHPAGPAAIASSPAQTSGGGSLASLAAVSVDDHIARGQ